jgi:hypothetical protein
VPGLTRKRRRERPPGVGIRLVLDGVHRIAVAEEDGRHRVAVRGPFGSSITEGS